MSIFSKYKYLKNYFLQFSNNNSPKGFTLIELLVVISIFTLITTALVVQQNTWNRQLNLKTQAYELLLYIRQAQIYSLGVRENKLKPSGDKFDLGYGIHINTSNPDRYIYFADNNKNDRYDVGEAVETKIFRDGVYVYNICRGSGAGEVCSPNAATRRMTITFYRPDPIVRISTQNAAGNTTFSMILSASVRLRSSSGQEVRITFDQQGQIQIPQ